LAFVVAVAALSAEPRAPMPAQALIGSPDVSIVPEPAATPARPVAIRCHDVAVGRCATIARAALDVTFEPELAAAATIDVWGSLTCGDPFDCPSPRLLDASPLGSAAVEFVDATMTWVNVVERDGPTSSPPPGGPSRVEAWRIRTAG
jgi:hypothetical protein